MSNINYITEYLPKRYNATLKQEQDREMCYAFKDGILTDEVKSAFLSKANEISSGSHADWTICFIPASTSQKTCKRFQHLADAFREAGYDVAFNAVYNKYDRESAIVTGKVANPTESFGYNASAVSGKRVIVIDDIITRGTTFNQVSSELLSMGARAVTGLFLAKTINPDYHPSYNDEPDYENDYWEPDYDESTYDNYNGSYAQDVEGWSDQDIDDVFDGDPEAYWNID